MEANSGRQAVSSDHLKTNALPHPPLDDVQSDHTDSDAPSPPQHSTSPTSTLDSDMGSEARTTLDHTQVDSALFPQLELLHQECQEKEALINKLTEQLADWEELHTQLQEKDQLNRQYVEALQAAESTIAYLTACNLDSQGGFGSRTNIFAGPDSFGSDAALYNRCIELQKDERNKEEYSHPLNMPEKVTISPDCREKNPEASDLCLRTETVLQQANSSPNRQNEQVLTDSMQELQRHADCLQEALWEQNRLNAELQEKLQAADAAVQRSYNSNSADQSGTCSRQLATESLQEKESQEPHSEREGSDISFHQEVTKVLMKCLSAAESAVSSLAAHCTNISSSAPGRSSQTSSDMQLSLERLHRALQEREELEEPTQLLTKSSGNQSTGSCGTKGQLHQELHNNLCHLYKVFSDNYQRISELQASLQEEKCRKEESRDHRTLPDAKGLPPSVQVQLETLHKALREKKKACKSLEEKLATALTNTPSPENTRQGENMQAAFCCFVFSVALKHFRFVIML